MKTCASTKAIERTSSWTKPSSSKSSLLNASCRYSEAQTLTYLRLSCCTIGLLMNFNCVLLKNGLHRFVASR